MSLGGAHLPLADAEEAKQHSLWKALRPRENRKMPQREVEASVVSRNFLCCAKRNKWNSDR
jgi:hypothetical protein